MKWEVTVTETFTYSFEVSAKDEELAYEKAVKKFSDAKIVNKHWEFIVDNEEDFEVEELN